MLKIEYTKDEDVVGPLIEAINEAFPEEFRAFEYSYESNALLIRSDPGTSNGHVYCMTFDGGVLYLHDQDVLFHETRLFGKDCLSPYDEDEINFHYPEAPQVKEDMTKLMTLLDRVEFQWKPSEEYLEECRVEGYEPTGFSWCEAGVEAELFTCFGFGGDPYWKSVIEAVLLPTLRTGMKTRFHQDDPLVLQVYYYGHSTCLNFMHPYHVEDEGKPYLTRESSFFSSSGACRRSIELDRNLVDLFEMAERHLNPEMRRLYRAERNST